MKIVFDASALISVAQTCLVKVLPDLREKLHADFIISPAVYKEIVSKPIGIKRFELNAIRLKELVESQSIGIQELNPNSKKFAEKISFLANNMFFLKNKPVPIMQAGEIEALALVKQLNANALVIDERTTRMLVESPLDLRSSMEKRYRKSIAEDKKNLKELQNALSECNILRSVELIAMAFEMNALAGQIPNTKKALEAALFAAKFAGCAVSFREITDFLGQSV